MEVVDPGNDMLSSSQECKPRQAFLVGGDRRSFLKRGDDVELAKKRRGGSRLGL